LDPTVEADKDAGNDGFRADPANPLSLPLLFLPTTTKRIDCWTIRWIRDGAQ